MSWENLVGCVSKVLGTLVENERNSSQTRSFHHFDHGKLLITTYAKTFIKHTSARRYVWYEDEQNKDLASMWIRIQSEGQVSGRKANL